jgi:sulfur-carrier protein
MAHVRFTSQLRRFTETPQIEGPAATLAEALDLAFAANPRLRAYVLDDQGHLRPNVAVFVDGRRCADPRGLTDPLAPGSAVYVMQALSGG